MNVKIKQIWIAGLQQNQLDVNLECYEVFAFGLGEEMAAEVIRFSVNWAKKGNNILKSIV